MTKPKRKQEMASLCGLPGCRRWIGDICRECIKALASFQRAEKRAKEKKA